jgi:hypothetical protein
VNQEPDPLPDIYSAELRFIIAKMLEKDVQRRPDVVQVLKYAPVRIQVCDA